MPKGSGAVFRLKLGDCRIVEILLLHWLSLLRGVFSKTSGLVDMCLWM